MAVNDYTFEQCRADAMLLGLRQASSYTLPTVRKRYKEAIDALGNGDPKPLHSARDRLYAWIEDGCPPLVTVKAQDLTHDAAPVAKDEAEAKAKAEEMQRHYDLKQAEWAKTEAVRRRRSEKPAAPPEPLVHVSLRRAARNARWRRWRAIGSDFRHRHKRLFALLVIAIVVSPLAVWLVAPGWIKRQQIVFMQNFDGGAPLYAGRTLKINSGALDGPCQYHLNDDRDCDRVASLIGLHVYEVLECIYGTPNGTYHLRFWHGRVPDDLDSYRIPEEPNPLRLVGTGSMDSCPSTLGPAKARFRATRFPDDPGN